MWLRFSPLHTRPSKSCWHWLVITCHLCPTSALCMILCPRYQPWLGWVMVNHSYGVTLHICNCSESYFKSIPASPMHCIMGGGVCRLQCIWGMLAAVGLAGSHSGFCPSPFISLTHHTLIWHCRKKKKKKSTLAGFADCLTWRYVIINPF